MKMSLTPQMMRLLAACLLLPAALQAQTATVYTPRGTAVAAEIFAEFSPEQITQANQTTDANYPSAQRIGDASRRYNCHAYAWYLSEAPGSPRYWINTPGDDTYWQDGSFIQICSESEAAKISYPAGDHSATRSGVAGKHDSKWGQTPLMRHDPGYTPASYNPSVRTFYAPTRIDGPNTICTTGTFSVASFTGGTYSWTSSPGIMLNTTSGASVEATNSGRGAGWIEVVISSPCSGTSVTSRINLSDGALVIEDIAAQDNACSQRVIYFTPQFANPTSNVTYSWDIIGTGASFKGRRDGPSVTISVGTRYNFRMGLGVAGECGESYDESATFFNGTCGGGTFAAYPNPASADLTIEVAPPATPPAISPTVVEFTATLYNPMGHAVRAGHSEQRRLRFDVQMLPEGAYYLRTQQGSTAETQHVQIKH